MEAQVDSFGPNSDDSFRTVELMGPPTLDVWMDIYQVMITAFITLGTLDLGTDMHTGITSNTTLQICPGNRAPSLPGAGGAHRENQTQPS